MKKIKCKMLSLLCMMAFASCSTEDVELPSGGNDTAELYEITDVAFAEYLMYNATLKPDNANALPYGICISKDDSFFLDVEKASTVTDVYLVKDATRIENLKKAGVASAEVKIQNIDGIRFFENCTSLKITSNSVVGNLDLSVLAKLETLEMNNNQVESLILPASVKRFRFNSSANTPEQNRLTSINLSAASGLNHLSLTNQRVAKEGFLLPLSYKELKEIDMTGNPDAPFEIEADLYAQLTIKNGVVAKEEGNGGEPEIPNQQGYEVKDRAFAEYLLYLTETVADADLRLPEGAVYESEGRIYINTEIASTFTGLLNISKAGSFITTLKNAGVATADVKISDADGLQHFTGVTRIVATSNTFTEELPLAALVNLESLIVRTAGVKKIDLSKNVELRYLDILGSAKLTRLSEVDLSCNINLEYVDLSANEIDPSKFVLPATFNNLTHLNMNKNSLGGTTVSYGVPSDLFNQLGSGDSKGGLVEIVD